MGLKSLKVPQPEFSNWVIKRRQELNLSPGCLQEKLNHQLSERTLKYLEDGKKDSYSEYTLNILAKGLDLTYSELLEKVEELKNHSNQNGIWSRKIRTKRGGFILAVIIATFSFLLLLNNIREFIFNQDNRLAADQIVSNGMGRLQDVLIHADYSHIIFAHDEKGNTLWQKNLDTQVIKVEVIDLDQNGSREVVAATYNGSYSDWGDRPGWLLVWNEKGQLLTEQNMWEPSIYPAKESHATIIDFKVVDLEKDGKLEIVVMIRGVEWYPSRLAILHYEDLHFKEVKTFWNPGHFGWLLIEDIDGDGFAEIICGGYNNDLKRVPAFGIGENVRSVFMLQGRSIFGQAPPYLGKAEKGSQVWYRYLTPTASSELSLIMGLSTSGERKKRILVKLNDTCFFYLNYAGEIVDRFYGDHCKGETALHLIPNEATW